MSDTQIAPPVINETIIQIMKHIICNKISRSVRKSQYLESPSSRKYSLQSQPRKNISSIKYPPLSTIMPATIETTARPKFCTACALKRSYIILFLALFSITSLFRLPMNKHLHSISSSKLMFWCHKSNQGPQATSEHRICQSHENHAYIGVQVGKGEQPMSKHRHTNTDEHPRYIFTRSIHQVT